MVLPTAPYRPLLLVDLSFLKPARSGAGEDTPLYRPKFIAPILSYL